MATDQKEQVKAEGIEEVREILFGARFREIARRIDDLERLLKKQLGGLRDELRGELSQVAADGRSQDDALDARVDAALARIDAVDEDSGKALNETRGVIEEQLRGISARLANEADSLRADKVSRGQLGELLVKLGRTLAAESAKATAE